MKIRAATGDDAAALAELVGVLDYPASADEMKKRLTAAATSGHVTLVAESGTAVVGFIGFCSFPIYESSQPIGYILALSVTKEAQGQGVGSLLVRAAEECFAANGVNDVRVASGFSRELAHGFYEKCGFQKTGYRFRKVLPHRE